MPPLRREDIFRFLFFARFLPRSRREVDICFLSLPFPFPPHASDRHCPIQMRSFSISCLYLDLTECSFEIIELSPLLPLLFFLSIRRFFSQIGAREISFSSIPLIVPPRRSLLSHSYFSFLVFLNWPLPRFLMAALEFLVYDSRYTYLFPPMS